MGRTCWPPLTCTGRSSCGGERKQGRKGNESSTYFDCKWRAEARRNVRTISAIFFPVWSSGTLFLPSQTVARFFAPNTQKRRLCVCVFIVVQGHKGKLKIIRVKAILDSRFVTLHYIDSSKNPEHPTRLVCIVHVCLNEFWLSLLFCIKCKLGLLMWNSSVKGTIGLCPFLSPAFFSPNPWLGNLPFPVGNKIPHCSPQFYC